MTSQVPAFFHFNPAFAMKMIVIPLPAGFDRAAHKEGESFEVTATVHLTPHGLEVEAIEGEPVESNESPREERMEDEEMDGEAFDKAMGNPMGNPNPSDEEE